MTVDFEELFARPKPVIAMVHTGPSPGVPGFVCVESAVERAIAETEVYLSAGVDGILVENMRDFPCVHQRDMGPEVAAFMTRVARGVKRRAGQIPVGIQVLFQANETALAVALAANCDFIRAEGWTYAHISDKGLADACAGNVVRYREMIGASDIAILADIRKKHASHTLTSDLDIADIAATMELHRADAIVVTGPQTSVSPDLDDLRRVREATGLPVLVGSGVTEENVLDLYEVTDGFIVGSFLKEQGVWHGPVSEDRVEAMVGAVERARAIRTAALPKN